MKLFLKILVGSIFLAITVSLSMDYFATSRGPFAYFRAERPELTRDELADYGAGQIKSRILAGATGTDTDKFLSDLGFQCKKWVGNIPSYLTSKTDHNSYNSCGYSFGFFGSSHRWRVSYGVAKDGMISEGKSWIMCPICQGV